MAKTKAQIQADFPYQTLDENIQDIIEFLDDADLIADRPFLTDFQAITRIISLIDDDTLSADREFMFLAPLMENIITTMQGDAALAIPSNQTIMFIGDSTTYGEGSADTERQGSFVEKIKALMIADGYEVNTNNFIGFGRTSSSFPNANGDDRISYTGSFSGNNVGRAIGNLISGSGGTISFTPDEDVDTFDVFMATGVGTDVSIDIDGGTADTYDVSSGSNDFQKYTISTALAGAHTLNIELNGFLGGVKAYDSATPKVELINVGVQSSRTSDWKYTTGEPWTIGQTWDDYGVNAFVISLGINDGYNSVSATDLEANLEELIDGIYAQNEDAIVILVNPNPYTESAPNQYDYIAKYESIATAYGIPLVDVRDAFGGDYATANSNGYMSDTLHPNDAGYEVYATEIYAALTTAYESFVPDTVPAAIDDFAVGSVGSTSAPVSFTAPDDGGADIIDYVYQLSTTSASSGFTTFADGTSTSTSTTFTGLTSETQYWARVAAVNVEGQGSWSNVVTFTTLEASEFAPTDISGLLVWLDASDTSTITESGGAASQIDDKSGNDNHFTQATGSRQPTATGGALVFDGSDDEMAAATAILPNDNANSATYTVVLVAEVDPAEDGYLVAWNNTNVGSALYNLGSDAAVKIAEEQSVAGKDEIPHSGSGVKIFFHEYNADELQGLLNGNDVGTNAYDYEYGTIGGAVMRLGNRDGGSSSGTYGAFSFRGLVAYNRADLTDTEKNNLGNYLAGVHGGTWSDL